MAGKSPLAATEDQRRALMALSRSRDRGEADRARAILLTLSIPRGQIAMAVGQAAPDAKSFTLEAVRGSLTNGIVSNPFLEQAFRTDRYTIKVDIHADGTWSYEQDTLLIIPGQSEPFHHTDRNRLRKIAEPTLNPMALIARQQDPAAA